MTSNHTTWQGTREMDAPSPKRHTAWWRCECLTRRYRLFMHKLMHQPGSPSYLASSVALGVLLAFIAPPGLQMLAALLAATVLRCNRLIATSAVWITNPVTMPFIYAGAYIVGALITGSTVLDDDRSSNWWSDLTNPDTPLEVLLSLLVGLVVLGAISAIISYLMVHRTLVRYQRRQSA